MTDDTTNDETAGATAIAPNDVYTAQSDATRDVAGDVRYADLLQLRDSLYTQLWSALVELDRALLVMNATHERRFVSRSEVERERRRASN